MLAHENAADSREVGGAEITKTQDLLVSRNPTEINGKVEPVELFDAISENGLELARARAMIAASAAIFDLSALETALTFARARLVESIADFRALAPAGKEDSQ